MSDDRRRLGARAGGERKERRFWLTAIPLLVFFLAASLWIAYHHNAGPGEAIAGGEAGAAPANLLLITLDTCRADYLSCYPGAQHPELTPNLDALAEQGVLCVDAITPYPVTLPSHASILSGLWPFEHGLLDNRLRRLGESLPTLASVLETHGYQTAAFVSAFPLDSRFGLDRGFQHYDDEFSAAPGASSDRFSVHFNERAAETTTDAVLEWLRERSAEPFFLWVHYFDPHEPYAPPAPFAARYPQDPYAGEVAYMDHHLGRLIEAVWTSEEQRERTLVVVVGDHGEALGQHGETTHGLFLYDEVMRVPLLFGGGRIPRQARKVHEQVSTIDLFPTLLALLELPGPEGLPGQNLAPWLLCGKEPPARPVYLETHEADLMFGWAPLRGLRTAQWKYIDAPEAELYFLSEDPGEEHNVITSKPEMASTLHASMRDLVAHRQDKAGSSTQEVHLDPEALSQLEGLGYLRSPSQSAGPGADWDSSVRGKPDPKARVHLLGEIDRLHAQFAAGNFPAALSASWRILEEDPGNALVRLRQAECLHFLKQYAQAEQAFRRLAEDFPADPQSTVGLVNLYLDQRQFEKALPWVEETVRRDPLNSDSRLMLGRVYRQLGQLAQAETVLSDLLRQDDMNGEVYLQRAYVRQALDDLPGALEDKKAYLELHPSSAAVWTEVANLQFHFKEAEQGKASIARALEAQANFPPALCTLAKHHIAEGDFAGARQAVIRALNQDPHYEEAKRLLQWLSQQERQASPR